MSKAVLKKEIENDFIINEKDELIKELAFRITKLSELIQLMSEYMMRKGLKEASIRASERLIEIQGMKHE